MHTARPSCCHCLAVWIVCRHSTASRCCRQGAQGDVQLAGDMVQAYRDAGDDQADVGLVLQAHDVDHQQLVECRQRVAAAGRWASQPVEFPLVMHKWS